MSKIRVTGRLLASRGPVPTNNVTVEVQTDGSGSYRLRFDAPPPHEDFWLEVEIPKGSLTAAMPSEPTLNATRPLTLAGLRLVSEDAAELPEDAPVFPFWADGPPSDDEPGVEFDSLRVMRLPGDETKLGVGVGVRLFQLGEDDADED